VESNVTIDEVFPWGRSYDEYRRMFALTDAELDLKIIACADGPAAFNAVMHRRGKRVISCDPLYAFSSDEIRKRIAATHDLMVQRARQDAHRFVWDVIRSPEEMGQVRMQAMQEFLADYDVGTRDGRYVNQALPQLGFANGSFDLALCSHFLFLYSEEFSLDYHLASIQEMCRVAREVRIFPLLDMQGRHSQHRDPVTTELPRIGFTVSIERVPYEFQCGGNEMMRVRRS